MEKAFLFFWKNKVVPNNDIGGLTFGFTLVYASTPEGAERKLNEQINPTHDHYTIQLATIL